MKKLLICIIILLPYPAHASITLPWSTTYDCSEWTQSDGAVNCDGLSTAGGWTCNGTEEQITSAANNSAGGGGRGQRHWAGDGAGNPCSGGLMASFASTQSEFWVRFYYRAQSGFTWNYINYDKILYIRSASFYSTSIAAIVEWQGDHFNVAAQGGGGNYSSSSAYGWNSVMGGATGDGQFHCFEVHLKMDTNGSNGIIQVWIDGDLAIDINNADLGTDTGWDSIGIADNQLDAQNGGCAYEDYDDFSVCDASGPVGGFKQDASGNNYIGPLGGSGDTTPPTLSGSVISSDGTTLTLTFDEAVTQGSAYSDSHWDIDCTSGGTDIPVTYSSGNGTTTHVYTISQTIYSNDSCNIDFSGVANSEEDSSGNDLAAIVSDSVTNNSTQTQSITTSSACSGSFTIH